MPSPALTTYNAAVDASALGAGAKVAVKDLGRQLYIDATREAARHILYHLDAEVAQRPDTPEVRNRADLIRAIVRRSIDATDNLALNIADGLDAGATR